jgi:hypothetical protein
VLRFRFGGANLAQYRDMGALVDGGRCSSVKTAVARFPDAAE